MALITFSQLIVISVLKKV